MAFSYNFLIERDVFNKRKASELQQKIKTPLKCYSVTNFKMIDDFNFEFNKSNRKMIAGKFMVFKDTKLHKGSYSLEDAPKENYRITITFHE